MAEDDKLQNDKSDAAGEDIEVLPREFIDSAAKVDEKQGEAGKSVSNLDTVVMRPSEVRRMKKSALSSRRKRGSVRASRRSRRISQADYTPEELARIKRRDRQAKIIIYAVLFAIILAFLAVATYKIPLFFPDVFPDGLWPWYAKPGEV